MYNLLESQIRDFVILEQISYWNEACKIDSIPVVWPMSIFHSGNADGSLSLSLSVINDDSQDRESPSPTDQMSSAQSNSDSEGGWKASAIRTTKFLCWYGHEMVDL